MELEYLINLLVYYSNGDDFLSEHYTKTYCELAAHDHLNFFFKRDLTKFLANFLEISHSFMKLRI